jgi:EH_Signature domain
VATESRFQAYLDQSAGELSARMLQGLVRSCHARWSPAFAAGAIVHDMKRRLEAYQGPHRGLARWREHAEMLLGPQGHCIFANSLLAARMPIKKHCEAWALEESSQYVLEAMRHAVHACQEQLGREEVWRTCLFTTLLPWVGWPVQDFHTAVGATILHPIAARDMRLQEALTTLVLADTRLGDPRLPRNMKNWLRMQEARQRFLQWLSRADINFFFEHVLPSGTDPHGRKAFWLRYVSRVLMSRPLLNRDDEVRLRVTMQSRQEQMGHFGYVRGRESSAFLLDFGPVVVVEFSRVGNACYLYEKPNVEKVFPDFWTQEPFTVLRLKNRLLAAETIVHSGRWQATLAQLLAQYGIRPA